MVGMLEGYFFVMVNDAGKLSFILVFPNLSVTTEDKDGWYTFLFGICKGFMVLGLLYFS